MGSGGRLLPTALLGAPDTVTQHPAATHLQGNDAGDPHHFKCTQCKTAPLGGLAGTHTVPASQLAGKAGVVWPRHVIRLQHSVSHELLHWGHVGQPLDTASGILRPNPCPVPAAHVDRVSSNLSVGSSPIHGLPT
jgi:hypothetical protein